MFNYFSEKSIVVQSDIFDNRLVHFFVGKSRVRKVQMIETDNRYLHFHIFPELLDNFFNALQLKKLKHSKGFFIIINKAPTFIGVILSLVP